MSHDIFVSYAHSDDVPPRGAEFGWVTTFTEELKKLLQTENSTLLDVPKIPNLLKMGHENAS